MGRRSVGNLRALVKKLGPYDLLRRLGVGATAEVFLAAGPAGSQPDLFALKVLLSHLAEEESPHKSFLKEARTASLLRHPNVGEIYEVGEVDGRPFIAMELC